MIGDQKDLYSVKITLTNLENFEELDISPLINTIRVINDYTQFNKPIFVIDLLANRYLANEINVSEDMKVQIEIRAEERLNNLSINQLTDDGNSEDVEPVLYDTILKPINHTKYTIPEAKDYDFKNKEDLKEEDLIHLLAKDSLKFRIEAFDIRHISISEKTVNVSMKNSTVEDVINVLVNQAKLDIEYFNFTKPDNELVYDQIFIPPMKLTAAIKHIDDKYGIYKDRFKFFLDDDSLYLLPFSKTINIDYDIPRKNPMEVKYVSREDKGDSKFELQPHALVLPDSPMIENTVAEAIKVHGDMITFLSYNDDGSTMSDVTVDTIPTLEKYINKKFKSASKYITNRSVRKEFFIESYLANLYSSMIRTVITYFNNNKQLIKPETIFSLDVNTVKIRDEDVYSGAWSVNGHTLVFTKSETYYTCSVSASINKIIDVSDVNYE